VEGQTCESTIIEENRVVKLCQAVVNPRQGSMRLIRNQNNKMKAISALLMLASFILAIQTSCKKTKSTDTPQQQDPPVTLDSMLLCHNQTNSDSVATRNALIGKWHWEYISCYWYPERANNQDFKNLAIEFKQNDSLEVQLMGQVTQRSSWSIVKTNDGYFKLVVEPLVLQLPGKILFCKDRLLLYDSYVDGCDNYYKK
jgi:hypothetical protein